MAVPTESELRGLAAYVQDVVTSLTQRLGLLQRDLEQTGNNLIAARATLAGLKTALGEPYDQTAVPFSLTVRPPVVDDERTT